MVFSATNYSALAGTWHHVAMTYDGRGGPTAANGITLYVDGVAVPVYRDTNAAYVAMENLAAPLELGREGPGWRQYGGGLDEVRLWSVARTASEIQGALTTELTGAEPGLRGYWRFNEGSGTTVAGEGPADQPATLLNGPLWVAGGPLAPDVVPPEVTNVLTSAVTASSLTVAFETSEAALAWVSYTATGACPCVDVYSAAGTTHVVPLTGLAADTVYSFVVHAQDAAGNGQTSAWYSVRTLVAGADVVAPTVTINQPGPGPVAGTVAIVATATDDLGVVSVQVQVDGANLGAAQTAAPYGANWATTTVADGPHTITVTARDAAGNVGTASVSVTVQNTPVISSPHYLEFDGIDDAGTVPDTAGLSFGTGTADTPLTMEAWVRANDFGRSQLVGKWGESNQEYKLAIVYGSFLVELRDHSAQASAVVFTATNYSALAGTWHHVAMTYDGRGGPTAANGITLYVDGVAVPVYRDTNAAYVAMENLAAPLELGREGPGWRQYGGGLDEVRLWSVARTASEIQGALTTELTGAEPGLRGYWRFNEGSGTTVAGEGPADQPATLLNGPQWVAGGPLAPDVVPPEVTNVLTSAVTASSLTVAFETSEAALAWVSYTATGACPCVDVYSAAGTTHVVPLTGLAADTVYSFVVHAQDAAGNGQTSAWYSVRTLVAGADVVAPTVTISQPGPGPVAGTVAIAATATDNLGVVSVQVQVDGANLGAAQTAAPYGVSWATPTVADGPHTITVTARDAAGNVGTASVTVTVQNTPVVASPHYLEFDGIDDAGTVPDTAGLSFGTGTADTPLTMEAWVRANDFGRSQLLGKWGESTNQEYKLAIVYGSFLVELRDQSAQASATVFSATNFSALAGTWHHVAVTYDGRGGPTAANGITLYVDGVAVPVYRDTNAAYVAMENLAAPLELGREGPGWRQYGGGLDEVRLWSVARTASEIQGALTTELTGAEPGLRGYWRFNEGSGTTVAGDGPADQPATLLNGPQWVAGGPLAPDVVPPEVTNVLTSAVTASSLTVAFETSEAALAWVSYTATGACPCVDVYSAAGTTHVVPLTGLAADTVYSFVVHAQDAAGNGQTSAWYSVRTLVAGADVVAPTVTISQPGPGPVAGTVAIAATATDNLGVVSVQVQVDGANLGAAQTAAPYGVSWATPTVADGPHTITVTARDAAGNVGTASVTVTVQNTPVVASPHYLEFDGIDDAGTVPDTAGLSFGTGTADTPLTMEAWVRANDFGRSQLVGKWGESTNQEYKLAIVYGSFLVELRDQSAQASAVVFTATNYSALAGTWHHVAMTYDGRGGPTAANGITLYVDGVAVPVYRDTNAAYVAMENLAAPLELGREGPGWRQYGGGLDEVRLWSVARTASEIQGALTTELTGAEPGLRGYWRFNEGSGTTVAGEGPADQPATLLNGPQWVAGGPLAPDVVPPEVTNVLTSAVTASSLTVAFETSEAALAWVSYTATGACPCVDVYSAAGTTHVVPLTGLAADTVYSFVVHAQDAAGNGQTSAWYSVRTLVAGADVVAPTVTISQPGPGPVAGTVAIAATATDDLGVVSVQVQVDGANLGAAQTAAPYGANWATTTVADGPHTITVTARDAAGNVGTASVSVTVQNTPVISSPHYLEFDGIDDAGTVPDTAGLSFGTGTADTPLTMEAWVRANDFGRSQLVGKWGESNQEYKLAIVYGSFLVELRDHSAQASAVVFTATNYSALAGTWHHVAMTYDGRGGPTAANGITLYVDGVAVPVYRDTNAAYVAMENLAAPLELGREGPGWRQYGGGLDEVRLWSVARTASEIQGALTTELTGAEPGLRGYWRFNEGSGTTVAGEGPADQPATLLNGPLWVAGGPLAPLMDVGQVLVTGQE